MDDKTVSVVRPSNLEQAKAALLSIFIGFIISALTVLFQYAIEWLRDIPAEIPGSLVGVLKYLAWRSSHHNV